MERLLDGFKSYVGWSAADEAALQALHPIAAPQFPLIAEVFHARAIEHTPTRQALVHIDPLRHQQLLVDWMDRLLRGPWDASYFELRYRSGRAHIRIALPQHYIIGAMSLVRQELGPIIDGEYAARPEARRQAHLAVGKCLELDLSIMLHSYRDDLQAQQAPLAPLARLGQIVGSICHELRQPLGTIETSLFLIKNRASNDAVVQEHVKIVDEQLRIASGCITSLLDQLRGKPAARSN